MRRIQACLAAAAAIAASPVYAQETPHIWPVSGLYGLEHSACNGSGATAPATAQVAPVLCPALDETHRRAIGARFVQLMLAAFPGAEEGFAAHMPASATPRARLGSTLIASLRLTRATEWMVDKPGGVDGFLPISLTLDIVNAATGEVVFSRHRSEIAQGQFPAGSASREIAAQFPARLDAVLAGLVAEAAAAWHPYVEQGRVIDEVTLDDGKAWVIDKGRETGLRAGDAIGEDGQVLHSGATYAVVRPAVGRYKAGDLLARTMTAPAAVLSRPSLLVSVGSMPSGYAAGYLAGIFEDALSSSGSFAPMPVTPGFTNLRTAALGEAQAVEMETRALPDFVASVDTVVLPAGHFPSNVPGVTVARFEAHVFVNLVDRTGRIVAAFHGTNRIDDQISHGMGFDDAMRQDTVLNNALLDAAGKVAQWHPRPGTLPVSERNGAIFIADPANALPLRSTVTVLRDAGRVGGLREDVLIPVAHITTREPAVGGVIAVDGDPAPYAPRGGDLLALDAEGPPLAGRGGLSQCLGPDGLPAVDDRGQVPVAVWLAAAEGILAAHGRWPVRSSALAARLSPLAVSFAHWERFAPAVTPATERCFTPVVRVVPEGSSYGVSIGYILRHLSDPPASSGLHIVLTPATLPAATPPAAAAAQLQIDLAARALPLAETVAAGIVLPADGTIHP